MKYKISMPKAVQSRLRSVVMRKPRTALFVAACALLLLGISASLGAGDVPVVLRWGEYEKVSKWENYRYPNSSSYGFRDQLPTLERFPQLLTITNLKAIDRQILVSQLRTLSRCSFLSRRTNDYAAAMEKWQAWWKYYGANQLERLNREGQQYPDAWKVVAGSTSFPCPTYPLVLPPAWSFRLNFRSGDYGAIVEEIISMDVTPETATLHRRFRRATRVPWEAEDWEGLTVADSRLFLAALIYAVDNPWLYTEDHIADRSPQEPPISYGHIKGRPKEWTAYYPHVEWTGVLDPEGRILINDDSWSYHGKPPTSFSLGDYGCGVVFRVIRDYFPDPTWRPERSRWKTVKPDAGLNEPEKGSMNSSRSKPVVPSRPGD